MEIYKHKLTGEFLMLVKVRDSEINTFLQVDELGVPIIKDRSWSVKPSEYNDDEDLRKRYSGF